LKDCICWRVLENNSSDGTSRPKAKGGFPEIWWVTTKRFPWKIRKQSFRSCACKKWKWPLCFDDKSGVRTFCNSNHCFNLGLKIYFFSKKTKEVEKNITKSQMTYVLGNPTSEKPNVIVKDFGQKNEEMQKKIEDAEKQLVFMFFFLIRVKFKHCSWKSQKKETNINKRSIKWWLMDRQEMTWKKVNDQW